MSLQSYVRNDDSVSSVRGVLLDSGDVLLGPYADWGWWPRGDFLRVVTREVPGVDVGGFVQSNEAAVEWFFESHRTSRVADAADEAARIREYHRRLLAGMGLDPSDDLLDAIDAGDGTEIAGFFPEAEGFLQQLRKRDLKLALVSDAGFGLRLGYEEAGLADYFEILVISSELGSGKPAPEMYTTALDALDIEPHEAIMLDDHPVNIDGAVDVGCHGVVLEVRGSSTGTDHPVVHSLDHFLTYVDDLLKRGPLDRG